MLQARLPDVLFEEGHQLAPAPRHLQIQYKSAWFLSHRIREAMRDGSLAPMCGGGKIVEVDETFYGKLEGAPQRIKAGLHSSWRNTILALVERGGSFQVAISICARLAEGKSLRAICSEAGMPGRATVFRWIARHKEFCDEYTLACELRAED